MDIINWLIIGIAILFIARRFLPVRGVRTITTEQLKQELTDKGKQFIDVRTPGEYKGNHIREFQNIPLHNLTAKAEQLSKDKEVVVICQSGMRSHQASKTLKKMGFKNVTNVRGGMSAW